MNPYHSQPLEAFWSRSVCGLPVEDVDPVVSPVFTIDRADRVATAGSCFAQHISRTLVRDGFNYLVTEPGPAEAGYGLFPARFANIYSVRQLLQLFQRAYGLFAPQDSAWGWKGAWVDPFRPQVQPGGFASVAALEIDRQSHLAAVRRMFEDCDIFIFTLGLTEAWRSRRDEAVFPLAPGVAGNPEYPDDYEFHNFTVAEMDADLRQFIDMLRTVNPSVRVMLTVSPVPLIATYEKRHVLASTIYSKSALRVVAEQVSQISGVAYFPSYEIITGHHTAYRYFAEDLREVLPEGVDQVMRIFARHYLSGKAGAEVTELSAREGAGQGLRPSAGLRPDRADFRREIDDAYLVICDEEAIEQ